MAAWPWIFHQFLSVLTTQVSTIWLSFLSFFTNFFCLFFFKSNQTHLPTLLPFTLNVTHHPSLRFKLLVWTPCLMHRCVCVWCVCIWQYILQNYNYKLHLQNLSIYHIPDVSIGTLPAENLDVCTACDPWDSNIQLTMGKDRRQQIYVGFVADIDMEILGVPPFGPSMPFQDSDTCAGAGGLFISARVFFPVWCHPWMDDGTDGWMDRNFTKNDHDVLYYMYNIWIIICYRSIFILKLFLVVCFAPFHCYRLFVSCCLFYTFLMFFFFCLFVSCELI